MSESASVGSDEAPPSPSEAYHLIERERAQSWSRIVGGAASLYLVWGAVWFVSFGLTFLRFGLDGAGIVAMPDWLPGIVLTALVLGGIGVTIVMNVRRQAGIVGASSERNLMYGLAWFLAFVMIGVIAGRLSDMLPPEEIGLLWSALSIAAVSTLYVAGAAIWRDRSMFALGIWIAVVNVAGVLAGPGWHSVLLSLAGGGGLLVAGILILARARRMTR
jgi:hypothetical protein